MNALIKSIEAEYLRYKALADAALSQVPEPSLSQAGPASGNSLAIICWHLSGNLKSRFTDFLTADGEKLWRSREDEFSPRTVTRDELSERWEEGWNVLLDTLAELSDVIVNGIPVVSAGVVDSTLAPGKAIRAQVGASK